MKSYIRVILFSLSFVWLFNEGTASEWQWSVPVRGSLENTGISRAFLWIPPDCKIVRGVIVAQHNMEEIMILENPNFRKALSEFGFAEIWCAPSFDHLFRFNQGAGETFNGLMEDLAAESGYSELKYVPVIGIGHSAAASWPYYFAAWNPERTLAAISVSGQWPYVRNATFSPYIWGDRNIGFIPCLETMGEYESANSWSTEGLKERQEHPMMPLSMLACPAEGHFAASGILPVSIDRICGPFIKLGPDRFPCNSIKQASVPGIRQSLCSQQLIRVIRNINLLYNRQI